MKRLSVFNNDIKRINVIGIPISVVNKDMVIQCVKNDMNRICEQGDYICVSNVHTTVMAHNDRDYYMVQKHSYLSVPDGMPLAMIGKRKYPEMNRVSGIELMKSIFMLSKETHYKHFFYGNTEQNLSVFIEKIKHDYPWIDIVGYQSSVFRELTKKEKRELSDTINNSKANIVWVALGAPRQELLCSEMKGSIHALMIGVGGVFNVMAGIVPDAPDWMKTRCLEWVYRLINEPKRLFKRYLTTNLQFLYYYLKEQK